MPGTRAMGGASTSHSEAAESDHYYRTPPSATEALLKVETFPLDVWECAAGDGAISDVLIRHGHRVVSTDLVDRGYCPGGRDFLAEKTLLAPGLITNPPYNIAVEFALHAFDLGADKVAFLVRLVWLEGDRRYRRLWIKHPPARVWVFRKRQTLWRGDALAPKATGGCISFCWMVWEKGHAGPWSGGWI